MPRCPDCGRRLFPHEEICRDCREICDSDRPSPPADELSAGHVDRVAVARFQNGAEAGYFADELAHTAGVAAEVVASERFDAVHAVWSIDYLLMVDREHAVFAANSLKALVDSTSDDADVDEPEGLPRSELPNGVWIPLILTLAAGSIACFGIERVERPPRPPALVVRDRREPPNLWHVLGSSRGPWRQALDNGPGERTLSIDPESQTAVLTEDHDGDGTTDHEWRFNLARP